MSYGIFSLPDRYSPLTEIAPVYPTISFLPCYNQPSDFCSNVVFIFSRNFGLRWKLKLKFLHVTERPKTPNFQQNLDFEFEKKENKNNIYGGSVFT